MRLCITFNILFIAQTIIYIVSCNFSNNSTMNMFLRRLSNFVQSATHRTMRFLRKSSSFPPDTPDEDIMDLRGQCALVMEGAVGVGYAMADELLRRKVATVIITGTDEPQGLKAASRLSRKHVPGMARFHKMHQGNRLEYENVFKYIKENFSAVDIFINNARNVLPTYTLDVDDVINTHLMHQIRGIILARNHMKAGSVIINHTSALGLGDTVVQPIMTMHCAASSQLIATSRAFSDKIYYQKSNIRIITLCSDLLPPVYSVEIGDCIYCKGPEDESSNDNIVESIAKSTGYLVERGQSGTLWLCERDRTLNMLSIRPLAKQIHDEEDKESEG